MIVFNNSLSTVGSKTDDRMAFLHYRSASDNSPFCDGSDSRDGNRSPSSTWHGYPCWRQPGRDVTGAYKPLYSWNNIWSDTGAKIDLTYDDPWTGTDYSSTQIVANREYYNAVSASAQTSTSSPFNGSTGNGLRHACGTAPRHARHQQRAVLAWATSPPIREHKGPSTRARQPIPGQFTIPRIHIRILLYPAATIRP